MLKFKYCIFLFIFSSLYGLTTLEVTISSDNNPGGIGEVGDLRYCLNTMNQGLNTISDDYEIIFASPMTIQLNGILPIINNSSNPVTITIGNASPASLVTLDGNNGSYRGFFIPMGTVIIQNMVFQNLSAKGGAGGNGISGGGGGLGAGGAIYAPQIFLNGSNPSITLRNVSIQNCSAVGGVGGNYITAFTPTGNEGGGGGGGFSGNGGSITVAGSTGGAGGGGFGGNGGNVTLSIDDQSGGAGAGGGGLGSRANRGILSNVGHGGRDQSAGRNGNGYGLSIVAGAGGGGNSGGIRAGGGAGGGPVDRTSLSGGGGGGSSGSSGTIPQGSIPPGGGSVPSGGNGGDGGGGGGGAIVLVSFYNAIDGRAGSGGYGGGGGGGAGTGAEDPSYTVQGGLGGLGGGGGGGGVNQSGFTYANGGDSLGGGGGGGGGPSQGITSTGGTDTGNLGGGSGGSGAASYGSLYGGGGGGGGSGLGGAIFVDSNVNFTIQAISGVPTTFNTINNTTQAGIHGSSGPGGSDGSDGSASGNSIFLRTGGFLIFSALGSDDLLTLGDQVAFSDDTVFGGTGTTVFVQGNGTVLYNGTTDYQGTITINNANFKVNGVIDSASLFVCTDINFSPQRGILSGTGLLTGTVVVNSGTVFPDSNGTLTCGSLSLNPPNPSENIIGALTHIDINAGGSSSISVTGLASLAGILEINIDPNALPGTYTILNASGITGIFDSIVFTGITPEYSLSYLPIENPTFVQFDLLGSPSNLLQSPTNFKGEQKKNNFGFVYELYNQLTWMPSPSPQTEGYFLYRNGKKIATLNSFTYSYQDHDQLYGDTVLYSLVAFDANGTISDPVTVIIS